MSSRDMRNDAISITKEAMAYYEQEDADDFEMIAKYIKKEMDRLYRRSWHVIVGIDFGDWVEASPGNFIKFKQNELTILIYKQQL